MRFYTLGFRSRPAILLIPGTCCHHSMFDAVTPLLTESFFVVVASFSGFDENGAGEEYETMEAETEAIEQYLRDKLDGHIACCYGSSLGGSFAAYLVQRGNVRIDHVIIGSSDMDEAGEFSAQMQAKLVSGLLYDILRRGKLPFWLAKINEMKVRRHPELAEYRNRFINFFLTPALSGGVVSRRSIYNQFYYDLVTRIAADIYRKDTMIHVFFADRMGYKYLQRYRQHFRNPDIRRFHMEHEELLACHPQRWRDEVVSCCRMRPDLL